MSPDPIRPLTIRWLALALLILLWWPMLRQPALRAQETTTSAASAKPEGVACAEAGGIEPLLAAGKVVLLGEIHGTNEAPGFVATLTCHALVRGLDVTIALELPSAEEPAVVEFFTDPSMPASAIIGLPFWAKPYQDGRTSRAMLSLLEVVRDWAEASGQVEVILIDNPSTRQRDRHMADRLLAAVSASPERLFIALTGNFHNRTQQGGGRMGEGVLAALGPDRVVSLNMTHAGGSAWICEATQGCGPLEFSERESEPAGQVILFEAPSARGYNGTFSVGTISASLPARGESTP